MSQKVTPLRDYILVKKSEPSKTPSGLILPNQDATEGTVVATGRGSRTLDGSIVEVQMKTGDIVMFNKHAGDFIKHPEYPDNEILLMKESDVYAIKRA